MRKQSCCLCRGETDGWKNRWQKRWMLFLKLWLKATKCSDCTPTSCSELRCEMFQWLCYITNTCSVWMTQSSKCRNVCVLQKVPWRVRLSEGGTEPELRLHQLRHLRLGLPVAVSPDDARLLGESLPPGNADVRCHVWLHRWVSNMWKDGFKGAVCTMWLDF